MIPIIPDAWDLRSNCSTTGRAQGHFLSPGQMAPRISVSPPRQLGVLKARSLLGSKSFSDAQTLPDELRPQPDTFPKGRSDQMHRKESEALYENICLLASSTQIVDICEVPISLIFSDNFHVH